ncbi:MAG: peptidase C1 [Lachnospiraceae bacterium]|nr:peptidase C1 [Lachnospiraceae bacterium]
MTACSYPWSFWDTEKRQDQSGVAVATLRTEEGQKENRIETREAAGTEKNGGEKQKDETEEDGGAEESDPAEAAEKDFLLPEQFDYREHGRCPEVGSQGDLGTCWAFATMMALESSLLPEEVWDFSEDHISLKNSFGMDQDMGGDYTMSMAYLLAWQGPVREEDDPYGDGVSPEGLKPMKHVQEIQIPKSRDYDAIKRAVYFHGGVQTSLYMAMEDEESQAEFYREETFAYYYNGNEPSNHDIVIVGWDDHYPRENFGRHMPKEDGAFLCVNSWGAEFGEQGLFYVSYEDKNIGTHNLVYTKVEEPDNYDAVYQSDLCGWLGQLGYGEESAYFANVYRAKEEETLEAVGFYATDEHTEYEVYVVGEAKEPEKIRLGRPVVTGRFGKAGFYTVPLPSPVNLKKDERFMVAVFVRTPGAIHPVAIEYQNHKESGATAKVDLSDGEGYISADGRLWTRVEAEQDSNVCLKAYTKRK